MKKHHNQIILKKVFVNNLKGVDLTLDHHKLIVFTGVSGSGKSSLAFDTIYVEGQKRYLETVTKHTLQKELKGVECEEISGLSPTVAIEQKSLSNNPRSTVGTITGIYDFLRLLYAKIGTPHCPISGEIVSAQSKEKIIQSVQKLKEGSRIILLSPYIKEKKGEFKEEIAELLKRGFTRLRVDSEIIENSSIELAPQKYHTIEIVIDRLTISKENNSQIASSCSLALDVGKGSFILINRDTNDEKLFSEFAYSAKSNQYYPPLQSHDFSFNHPLGMCPKCHGMGETLEFSINAIINPELSIADGCCYIASSYSTVRYKNIYDNLAKLYSFSVKTPWRDLPPRAKRVFLYGCDEKWTQMFFTNPQTHRSWIEYVRWEGVLKEAKGKFIKAKSELYRHKMQKMMKISTCSQCNGERIRPYPAATLLGDKRISEVCNLSLDKLLHFLKNLRLNEIETLIGREAIKEIVKRIEFLLNVGLHYLSIGRNSPSLSGGEAQRVKIASQIGSGLMGTTYILDEPSIGLHARDQSKLIDTLKTLKFSGNTVIVVEHDVETMKAADIIVDVGVGGGKRGGEILAVGDIDDIKKSKRSITGKYLKGELSIEIPKRREPNFGFIKLLAAAHNNLKNINVNIPLSLFVCITGVSGSGKSSLISDTLYPALYNKLHNSDKIAGKYEKLEGEENLKKVILVDQSPIGRTPRSNLATYTKLYDDIRELFATLVESKAKGFDKGYFSFNLKEGNCPYCKGLGEITIDMDFLEDEKGVCPQCHGERFSPDILNIKFKDKNICDILKMEVGEALEFFENIPNISHKLELLTKVGLDYLPLGQSATTLSGGEAQRIKLAKELIRPSKQTLYILDEPTTGLHLHDIKKLIVLLNGLVELENSVVVIEHNMDFIKVADWIIDLGLEGGDKGGEIVGEGSPETIAKLSTPTGIYLKKILFPQKEERKRKVSIPKILFDTITIKGATQNNLKNLSCSLPRNKISIFTGPSGSGKSSLAFDTIYAEGERRYLETLPPFLRQHFPLPPKAAVEKIEGLSPSIAIEQKGHRSNPRSTVGTMTEIYDLFRVLFAKMGIPHCPESGEKLVQISKEEAASKILQLPVGGKIEILAPVNLIKKKETFNTFVEDLKKKGFLRIRLNKEIFDLDEKIPFNESRKNELFVVIDRLILKGDLKERLLEDIKAAEQFSAKTFVVANQEQDLFFNLDFAAEKSGKSYPPITPRTFSFNSEEGMCLECDGLGFIFTSSLSTKEEFLNLNIKTLLYYLLKEKGGRDAEKLILDFFHKNKISLTLPLKELNKKGDLFFNSDESFIEKDGLIFEWRGVNNALITLAKKGPKIMKELLRPLLEEKICPSCQASRLNPLARAVTINDKNIPFVCNLPINELLQFLNNLALNNYPKYLQELLERIKKELTFLIDLGLNYLSLSRSLATLSGGEAQRVRLSKQIKGGLVDCLYILDEPTIGLHPYNCELLNKALLRLKELNNTLILVEHDPMTISIGDYFLDFGPKAGIHGGEIVAMGTLKDIKSNPVSLTGAYLSGEKNIPIPTSRKKCETFLHIEDAKLNNLKNISLKIQSCGITTICGVSGSGKSTLLQILKEALELGIKQRVDKVDFEFAKISGIDQFSQLIYCSQAPIGQSSRSDVATYSEILPLLRYFLAQLPSAKVLNLRPMHFSYNHLRGMCRTCWGLGYKTIDLQFLPRVKITCETCHGYRLNQLSLEVKYQGKHLGEILELSVEEAISFFSAHPRILKKLNLLKEVGLEYLKLNQELSTLSGGEGQRLKLINELSKKGSSKALYIFDEPTIGLHSDDVVKLLKIFHTLANKNAVVIVEHNLDLIANSDYLFELGVGAGKEGGEIIARGTPEELIKNKKSITALYLTQLFRMRMSKKALNPQKRLSVYLQR